ncbi:DNA mismatch repair protein MutT [Paenibacillus baekrokdamisoli]|uniref:DNA mismatch repair protein MutT n=1 Tax=Paenibacillus baekrokdamisoli TaxID=1712516 RepID=A0A3G9J3Q4_9BACL|nr:NUDIX hydrolase [Paenibacillus baekrokdamisoli]MBB3073497.1 8-oxo-dGTP pyrophosphatase MutT (NUDIX family) [Paenibacillus baekrokdamisoli]BBH20431.1 DNA mismatch repair protein MutT [Paenibacillus baekrokdamisoli]
MGYIMDLRQIVGTRPLIMTGACVIIIDKQDRILLQLRADNGLWGLPGGSLEPGESMEEVAKRELFEETGLIADEINLLDVFSGKDLYYQYPHGDEVYNVIVAYTCREYQGNINLDEKEVKDIKFFNIQDIPSEISPPDIPIINNFLKKIREVV